MVLIDHPSAPLSLSSGTIGAALASSLSGVRSIALSYGIVIRPIPTEFHDPAFKLSSKIVNHLFNNWSPRDNRVLYSVNLPMIENLLHDEEMKVYWTTSWKTGYGRLFSEVPGPAGNNASGKVERTALQTTDGAVPSEGGGNSQYVAEEEKLVFKFVPNFSEQPFIQPAAPEGSDGWALNVGAASVTPYLTSFAELPEDEHGFSCVQDREWKFKL